ncbi:hypothetical protein EWM64_g10005, partial [Hericium alpestre]
MYLSLMRQAHNVKLVHGKKVGPAEHDLTVEHDVGIGELLRVKN